MSETDKIQKLEEVLKTINDLSLRDQIELIGNLMIHLGKQYIEFNPDLDSVENLLAHHKKHGPTIENSIAFNGLTILSWLDS